MSKIYTSFIVVFLSLLIQACSGNGFKLRKNVTLAPEFNSIYVTGVNLKEDFATTLTEALIEAGGNTVDTESQARSLLNFSRFEQGRRVIAYTDDRQAREYLVFLKVEYDISQANKNNKESIKASKKRINIDRTYLFDPDFTLGKSEEEKRVIQTLYEEATRLILLRLKYAEKT